MEIIGGKMLLKRSLIVLIVLVFCLSIPCFSQTKNRVVIAEGDVIKLFEYDPAEKKFNMIWESAETGTAIKSSSVGIVGMELKDLDKDGKNELVAIDQFGIFVWGKNGKMPVYYNLKNAVEPTSWSYVLPVDLDSDGFFEFVTQRESGVNVYKRTIAAWKVKMNELVNISEIELPGNTSWSLRAGDCDNDKTMDILSSGHFIHVLGWEETAGFFEKARFINNSQMVDVVQIADVDGNGTNEILASGNSGCFSVYSARKIQSADKYYYPVIYQSTKLVEGSGHYTQGLAVADIDGNGKNELLVGVSASGGGEHDDIFVYDYISGQSIRKSTDSMTLKKVFSMKLESSSIPGFVAGDLDNDGSDEIIYNNKYVLKFTRDSENQLHCTVLATLVDQGSASLIGPFQPTGEDITDSTRIVPQNLFIDLKDDEIIESGKNYKIWVKVNSPWKEAKNVLVRLESEMEKINVLQNEFQLPVMQAGKTYDNRNEPFLITPDRITAPTDFSLRVKISTEDGYMVSQSFNVCRSSNEANFHFSAVPKFEINSDTLAIGYEADIYKDIGISYDYFDDDDGLRGWPQSEALLQYKNLIILKEYGELITDQKTNLKLVLDQGGNCLVHGYEVLNVGEGKTPEQKEDRQFIETYFHTRYVKQFEGERVIQGKSSDSISNDIKLQLKEKKNEYDLPDVLEALPGAIPIFFYPSGEVAGVRIEGKYKLVYLGFSLDDIQQTEVKKELIKRIMEWFDQE